MKDFVVSSALTRLLANVFIFLCLLAALFVCMYQTVNGQALSPIAYTIVSTGLSYALMILGVHAGGQINGSEEKK